MGRIRRWLNDESNWIALLLFLVALLLFLLKELLW